MPTTATVAAAPRRYTAEDIASGLRAFADILEAKPELAENIRFPNVPQRISFGVTSPADVEAFAVIFDTAVEEADNGEQTYVSATGQLGALRVSAYAIVPNPEAGALTRLAQGGTYIGTTTGVLRGARVERDVTFIASRDQDIEPFIRDRKGCPDQDRVFVVHPHGSVPQLFVTGSIRPGVSA